MDLNSCLRLHTNRQYAIWTEWLKTEWNTPNRTDNYLMQIAAEVRRSMSSNPKSVSMKDFQIEFTFKVNEDKEEVLSEEYKAWLLSTSKARWLGIVGKPPDVVNVSS